MNQRDNRLKIFDAIRHPILLIDRHYTIVDVNKAACALMNLTCDKIVGQACSKATHGLDRPCRQQEEISCPVQSVFELKSQTVVVHKHIHAGKIIIEEVVASPIFNDEGEIDFVVEELRDVTELIHIKEISEHLRSEIKNLRGIIPICASCKRIRDDKGYWQQVEAYVRDHSEAEFSHGICPECVKRLYGDLLEEKK